MKMTQIFRLAGLVVAISGAAAAQPQPGTVQWTYQAAAPIQSSPALGADGTVYLVASELCAVTNSGSLASNKWAFPASGAPAVGPDGSIYCAGAGGLAAVNPDGSPKWVFPAGGTVAIGVDSRIYFVAGGQLYVISASGTKCWQYPLDPTGIGLQLPVLGIDGSVYVGLEHTLYAFGAGGTNTWSATLTSGGNCSLAIGIDGTVYSSAGQLEAISPGGGVLWSTDDYAFGGSVAVGGSGTVYAVGGGRALFAITAAGQISWRALATNNPQYGSYTCPAVDAAGRIYHCVSNSVWCLSPEGKVQWNVTTAEAADPRGDLAMTSPIIGTDGTLYVALGKTLYAIATGSSGPADSPWPMYRQNARHTGKVERPVLKYPQKRSDANFQFQLYAQQLGLAYTVEASTNLTTWTRLTNLVATSLPMEVVDLAASNTPTRFYRASSGP